MTCLIDVHPPQRSANELVVPLTLPITLALVHQGVVRRWLIAAEALRPKLDPGEQVAVVQFFATPDAVARCVPVRLAQVFPQQTWLPVLDALTVPGS